MNKDILLIDKPEGWTSFDVVAKIRGALRKNDAKIKVGHAGTLDPFATGLLIILIGSATKRQNEFMKLDKEYEATLILGATSATGDPEGEISSTNCDLIPEPNIDIALRKFVGKISQVPHRFSAIKVNGKRAYKLAREGEKVELEPREVEIYGIELVSYNFPELKIRVKCSSGTYIRSLAEDIGKELDCGAYLSTLRRTKIGEYSINDAATISDTLSGFGS